MLKSGVSEIKALTLKESVESHLRLCETSDTSILKLSSAYSGEDSGEDCRGLVEKRVNRPGGAESRL